MSVENSGEADLSGDMGSGNAYYVSLRQRSQLTLGNKDCRPQSEEQAPHGFQSQQGKE
jgi:hypothetical protein